MLSLWFLAFSFLLYCIKAQENSAKTEVVYGLLPVSCEEGSFFEGSPVFPSGNQVELYIHGQNLNPDLLIGISRSENCEYVTASSLTVNEESHGIVASISFMTPATREFPLNKVGYHICLMSATEGKWQRQGAGEKVAFYVYDPLLTPVMWLCIIILCFIMSSLMSGLNIGLMSLDLNELQLLKNSGTRKEKIYAGKIIPVRRNGNYLLCSILITATLCNSIATVSIENFTSDYLTVIITTIIIVLLCEVLPQSICTYFPLLIGANTVFVTRACMIFTAPVSYPLSLLLNLLLGKELQATYTKDRLKELLKLTQLPANEEKIITGALDLSGKKVDEIMTLLNDIFKLPITAVMDFETIALILASGYSRVPIYVGDKSNIQYVLLTKDLALLDPDDKVPVKVLVERSKYKCHYIVRNTPLDSALALFKDSRGHMVFVVDKLPEMDDKEIRVVGLVTFEDIIEEIFQMEINDETDMFSDNRNKRRLSDGMETNTLLSMLKKNRRKTFAPSENLKLAAFHFLTGIDAFSIEIISPTVLLSLLSLDIYYVSPGKKLPRDCIFVQGVPADYFVMVLEGLMEVKIGSEDLKFEAGPFRYFGLEALKKGDQGFTPDYTLQAVQRSLFLKITKVMYEAALLATKYERIKQVPDISSKSELYLFFKLLIGTEANIERSSSNSAL